MRAAASAFVSFDLFTRRSALDSRIVTGRNSERRSRHRSTANQLFS
jgi:hypothetical protein